jgi:hypothetical protein
VKVFIPEGAERVLDQWSLNNSLVIVVRLHPIKRNSVNPEIEQRLQLAWNSDWLKKAERKKQREELRAIGQLGKKTVSPGDVRLIPMTYRICRGQIKLSQPEVAVAATIADLRNLDRQHSGPRGSCTAPAKLHLAPHFPE